MAQHTSRADDLRRLGPVLAAVAVGLALIPVTPGWQSHDLNAAAAVLGLGVVAALWLLRRPTLPAWLRTAPVYLLLPMVGLLRHAHGGSDSGYAPLALVPILWLALHCSRVALVGGLLGLLATFTLPLLLARDPVLYPSGSWRLATLLVLTGLVVGVTTQELTRRLALSAADLRTIGRVARSLPSDERARTAVCEAVREVSHASFAMLLERDGSGRSLVSTAAAGTDLSVCLSPDERSAAATAFRSGVPRFIGDCARDPEVSPRLLAATGAASLLLQPVERDGAVIGVLALGFDRPLRRLRSRLTETVAVLAAEAAQAIERADLVDRLSVAARTDGLTGAANRHGWDVAVEREWALTAARPRVVALLDLDHFKHFNDTHGHLTGDLLLKTCVRVWRSVLRPGDTLARWGGEEFSLLLPGCTESEAQVVLDRLREVMPAGCTVSIGAGACLAGEAPSHVLAGVDAALYAAKAAGRDTVRWRPSEMSLPSPEEPASGAARACAGPALAPVPLPA